MSISVKISKENYEWLNSLSGELRKNLQRPISINEALSYLHKRKKMKLSDLAGTLKMDEKEAKEFLNNLRRGWDKWKIKSV